jgi:hypothetical protein
MHDLQVEHKQLITGYIHVGQNLFTLFNAKILKELGDKYRYQCKFDLNIKHFTIGLDK